MFYFFALFLGACASGGAVRAQHRFTAQANNALTGPHEKPPLVPWIESTSSIVGPPEHCTHLDFGPFRSVQVNVDSKGCNIRGDAANEPSIAINRKNPNQIVIGWRQFDSIDSDMRQPGYAYSHTGGTNWTFPGSLAPGEFGSDPVLASDPHGNIFYYSIESKISGRIFKTSDGGVTWEGPQPAFGGDKPWMAIDNTDGPGRGNIYVVWRSDYGCCGPDQTFTRSFDAGTTFVQPAEPAIYLGTIAVGPDGAVYFSNAQGEVRQSADAFDPQIATPAYTSLGSPIGPGTAFPDAGACVRGFINNPNGDGLSCQSWVAVDSSAGPNHGTVYVLLSPLTGVYFSRRVAGESEWTETKNLAHPFPTEEYQHWFASMSVAPSGRIDVTWNRTARTEDAPTFILYTYSLDAGKNWTHPIRITHPFLHRAGMPVNQNKIGDYYHMLSDDGSVMLAYAATFNGEQDIYFLRFPPDCNANGRDDQDETALKLAPDCDGNRIPDECQPDCDGNEIADSCDIAEQRAEDCNSNGKRDDCETSFTCNPINVKCSCDADCDGVPSLSDVCPCSPKDGLPRVETGRPIGDANPDCRVDAGDLGACGGKFFRGPGEQFLGGSELCDFDLDLDVDMMDIAALFQIMGH